MIKVTATGCWCSYYERADGLVDYTFWRLEVELEHGVCSRDEMAIRFHALDNSAALPLH